MKSVAVQKIPLKPLNKGSGKPALKKKESLGKTTALKEATTLPIEYRLIIGVVGFTALVLVGKYLIVDPFNAAKENISQNQAANQDSPAGVAASIWAAAHTGWWGATEDEEAIVNLAKKIPTTAFYGDVIKAYRAQHTGRELETDLVDWLSFDEYQQFKSIIAQNQGSL